MKEVTYKQFIENMRSLPHKTSEGKSIADCYADTVEIWSNYACIGYLRLAMQSVDLTDDQADKLLKAMRRAFDDYTIDEAETYS